MSTIEEARQAQIKVLERVNVKDKRSASQIEVEWDGTLYSGKFGSLISLSDEQLQEKHAAPVAQGVCFREICCTHTHICIIYILCKYQNFKI